MGLQAAEALGSMGNDLAMAALSKQPRNIFDYFQQLFAQVRLFLCPCVICPPSRQPFPSLLPR